MKKLIYALLILNLCLPAALAQSQAPMEASKGADILVKLEAEFAQAVAAHGRAAFVTYFAEEGVELDDGGGVTSRAAFSKLPPWPEGTSLTWTPVKAEMSASGDLGYTYGNYVLKSKNKEGKIVPNYGKYMSIWKKQKDGSWKVVADMGNSSPEPKAAE